MCLYKALRAVSCGSDQLNVECFDGDTITVINANYGRRGTDTCPDSYANDTDCVHAGTLPFVDSRSNTHSTSFDL